MMVRVLVLISALIVAVAAQTTGLPTGKCCRWCRESLFNVTNVQPCAILDQEECFTWETDRFVCSNTSIPEASWRQSASCPCVFAPCCIGCQLLTPPHPVVEAEVCHNTEIFDCRRKSLEKQCSPDQDAFFSTTSCALCANATTPECSDGIDNDNDTFTDFPADPDCADPFDDDESTVVTTGTSGTTGTTGIVTTATSGTSGTSGTTGSPPPPTDNGETTLSVILAVVLGFACLCVCCGALILLWRQQRVSNGVYYQAVPAQNAYPTAYPYQLRPR